MNTEQMILAAAGRRAAETGEGRQLRRAARVGLREGAGTIGVDPATFSRWERGLTVPTGDRAVRYGRLLRLWLDLLPAEYPEPEMGDE